MTEVTPSPATVAVWHVPHPDTLTMAELDEVLAVSGIDVSADDVTWGRVVSALVVWQRRKDGETVTIDDVYRTVKGNQIVVSKVDPTNG